MAQGYILIYPCSYHGNGIYLEYVPIVPFDVRCQSGICISYNMGKSGLPDIYTRCPRAAGPRARVYNIYIRQTTSAHVITFIYHLLAGHIELHM